MKRISEANAMLHFNLDKKVGLSFYEQIKGQLLSAIYCGKIEAGDRLPSMRELAEEVGVSYSTVRKTYQRLCAEGYLEMVHGSGAFLRRPSGETSYADMRRRAVYKFLSETSARGRGLGLSADRIVQLLDAYARGRALNKISFAVVDHSEEALVFSREIRTRIDADVFPIALDDASGNGALDQAGKADYLLTTSWHFDQVQEIARKLGKQVLEIKPDHQIYTEILNAARDANVGIVIQDEKTMHASWEIFMNLYHPSTANKFWIAPIERSDLVDKIIREADVIFVSPICWDEMRRRTPAEKELKTYSHFISDETIQELRQIQLIG